MFSEREREREMEKRLNREMNIKQTEMEGGGWTAQRRIQSSDRGIEIKRGRNMRAREEMDE